MTKAARAFGLKLQAYTNNDQNCHIPSYSLRSSQLLTEVDGGLLVVEGVLHAIVAMGLLVDHGVGTGEVHDLTGDVIPEVIHFFQAVGVILGGGFVSFGNLKQRKQ